VSFWAIPVRRLVVSAKSRPKGGDMKHTHRKIDRRVKRTHGEIDRHVQAAREQAIIRYLYAKRG
jgi:hypothetical protein